MTKIRCLVVDDERLALEVMEAYIDKIPFLHLEQLCTTPMQALEFLSRNTVDVVFLDIEMPGLTGLQFLQTLRYPPPIVFTTAYPQFAVEAFELNALDYLLKPIPFKRFLAAVQKLQLQLADNLLAKQFEMPDKKKSEGYIFIQSGSKTVRIDLLGILFIEGKKDHVLVHTLTSQVKTQHSLNAFIEKLPASQFLRVHRSFIIALAQIDSMSRTRITIGRNEIPIGDFYRDDLIKRIS